ncbi:hypothetical protein [Microbacterium sp. SS28]|uniref:hypothetical protein n=1 Tax=Microbacterium sp. SS28 TaxID=2919948 RepID=UPI001FA9602D|nr:hypothetical protein [Microbacterium sp. SS28]
MNAQRGPGTTVRDERAAEAAASIARGWVRWYSGFVGAEASERRRAEIESDLWEQRADARQRGARPMAAAVSIASRVVGGVPHDLLWVRTQRLTMRGLQAERKAIPVNPLDHTLSRWWWVAGAAVLAAIFLGAGIDNLTADYGPLPGSAAQCFAYMSVLIAGIACSYKAPRTSAALIAPMGLVTVVAWWAPPLVAFGIAIAVGAIIQLVRLSATGFLPRAGAVLGALLLGVAAVAPAIGASPAMSNPQPFFMALALACAVGGTALLVVTRARAPRTEQTRSTPSLVA